MKLSPASIRALQKAITGDPLENSREGVAPRKTADDLDVFFRGIPAVDPDLGGGLSRWRYVETVLHSINGQATLASVVREALHPSRFVHSEHDVEQAAAYLNDYFGPDGYHVRRYGKGYKAVAMRDDEFVPVDTEALARDDNLHEVILEQIEKARDRLDDGDYDGTITSARSLLEAVLKEMDRRLMDEPTEYKGDLMSLYKGVQGKLNLDPKDHDAKSLKKILSGLNSIVDGVGTLRDRMGDAHPRTFKPDRHHALLAINAASTAVGFLFDTHAYQEAAKAKKKG